MSRVHVESIPLSADDREPERALRDHFARFWGEASNEPPRARYDAFIAGTPMAEGASSEPVDEPNARGWWVRPPVVDGDGVLFYVHGGGYVAGSAKAYRGLASQIAARARRPVFVLDYPLAPEATVPAAPDAAVAAYEWLAARHAHVSVAGDSAGGGLALVMMGQLAQRARTAPPVAAALFSPWVDLAFTGASMTDASIPDPLLSHEYLQDCARKVLGGVDPRDPRASPLYAELRALPPLLIQVGSDERLLDDARQLAERAAQAEVRVRLERWEGMHHVFQLDLARLAASRAALDRAAAFLVVR